MPGAMALDSLARAEAPLAFARPGSAETLLLIDVINAEGRLIMHTVWATTPDRRWGHRLTRVENIPIGGINAHAALMQRLAELAPAICWQDAPLINQKTVAPLTAML